MKRISILIQILMLALIISACGGSGVAEATPTIDPVDLQSTMAVAALRIAAETQAAIPTATVPPTATLTNTPDATATLPILPTLGATFTASPAGNSGADDPCINQVMPASLEGERIRIRIDNPTGATINVSVNLHQARPGAQCGYRGYSLEAGQSLVISDLVVGCYSIWAWNPDPDDYFMVTNGTSCLDTSNTWAFDISPNGIRLRQ